MPASYPVAVKTFTTKNPGDTIQPGHINDLQDEVAAIESGLLAGTSPLQSSNSTVAALTVSGGSTLATLQVNGNSTIAGTLTVNKIISTSIVAAGVTSYVRAYAGSSFGFSTAAATIPCNQELADLLGEYDSTTYTFTPQSSGYYLIHARMTTPSAAAPMSLGVYINSSLVLRSWNSLGAGNNQHSFFCAGTFNLSSGAAGAVQIKAFMDASTGSISSGVEHTGLDIIRLF